MLHGAPVHRADAPCLCFNLFTGLNFGRSVDFWSTFVAQILPSLARDQFISWKYRGLSAALWELELALESSSRLPQPTAWLAAAEVLSRKLIPQPGVKTRRGYSYGLGGRILLLVLWFVVYSVAQGREKLRAFSQIDWNGVDVYTKIFFPQY